MKEIKLTELNINRIKETALKTDITPAGFIKNSILRARRILRILKKYNFSCAICKSKEHLTIDHINGRQFAKWDNATKYIPKYCQVLCVACHNKKNDNKRK